MPHDRPPRRPRRAVAVVLGLALAGSGAALLAGMCEAVRVMDPTPETHGDAERVPTTEEA